MYLSATSEIVSCAWPFATGLVAPPESARFQDGWMAVTLA